jgi:hypothetical protein
LAGPIAHQLPGSSLPSHPAGCPGSQGRSCRASHGRLLRRRIGLVAGAGFPSSGPRPALPGRWANASCVIMQHSGRPGQAPAAVRIFQSRRPTAQRVE